MISIHASREGGDSPPLPGLYESGISIHASREGGDSKGFLESFRDILISIHASREGGDDDLFTKREGILISIHASREGGDPFFILNV